MMAAGFASKALRMLRKDISIHPIILDSGISNTLDRKTFWENEMGPHLDRRLCRAEAQWFTRIIIFQCHFRIDVSPWVKPKGGENIRVVVVCQGAMTIILNHGSSTPSVYGSRAESARNMEFVHVLSKDFAIMFKLPKYVCSVFHVSSIDLLYLFHHVVSRGFRSSLAQQPTWHSEHRRFRSLCGPMLRPVKSRRFGWTAGRQCGSDL